MTFLKLRRRALSFLISLIVAVAALPAAGESGDRPAAPVQTAPIEADAAPETETDSDKEAAPEKDSAPEEGVLRDYRTTEYASKTGFSFHVISDEEAGFAWGKTQNGIGARRVDPVTYHTLYEEFVIHGVTDFKERPEDANAFYDRYDYQDGEAVLKQEDIEIDGHPARIVLRVSLQGGMVTYIGGLYYVRNNTVLKVRLLSIPPQNSTAEPPKVTVADMARIAEGVHYDESAAELKQEDGQFRILCQEGVSEILAGQTLNFEALFENGTVGQKKNLSRIDWRVKETETGTAPEEVSLSDKGQLTTRKKISRVINLTVTAESPVFHTSAEYSVTVIPAVSGVKVSPNRLIMYLAEGSEATVQASMIPDNIPPVGLTWSVSPRKTVEIVPGDDGMAVIRPLASGKATVTVTGLGGKKAQLQIRIVEPVTDISLSIGGTPRPGGKVRVIWSLIPKGAGVKDVSWSLDVDSSIATISRSGNVTISPDAPSGTMITVTCNAYGAPEPVSRFITFTVR